MRISRKSYQFVAVNTSAESDNKIHSDAEARRYGFRGALVPGVGILAYVGEALRDFASKEWLLTGFTGIRFRAPAYDGETITVTADGDRDGGSFVVTNDEGRQCAAGTFSDRQSRDYSGVKPSLRMLKPWPAPRPLDKSTLVDIDQLPSVDEVVTAGDVAAYFLSLGLDAGPYLDRGIVPASYVARLYSSVWRNSFVRVGPSLNAGAELQLNRPILIGEKLNLRARVDRLFARGAQRFWAFEIGYYDARDKPAAWDLCTGVYEVAVKEAS